MRRAGPKGVTFSSVAAETGLSAPTLVQRFGTKPALLRAALLRAWDLLDARTAVCDAAAPATPAGAVELLVALSEPDTAADYTEGLLVLREDLRDPVLRRRGVLWGEALAEMLGRRLAAGGAPRFDLGRLMAAQWQGTLLWWSFSRRRPAGDAVARSLRSWCRAIGIEA